jgi:hypothetical protein
MSYGASSYIRMYINAVAGSVMLYLQYGFYNIIFKIKHKLYIASGSAPTPRKNCGCAPGYRWIFKRLIDFKNCVNQEWRHGTEEADKSSVDLLMRKPQIFSECVHRFKSTGT